MIRIEVAFALPERQTIMVLEVADNCSVLDAAKLSGIDRALAAVDGPAIDGPEIDWSTVQLGIFGNIVEQPAEHILRDGDRIEIYRPLLIDPKAVRKQRADHKKQLLQQQRAVKPTTNN
ncbi:MAG TPA: RnfH family protein [Spongiibacteraceae bacterium]|nr:RnfH family protein [Spongiibacteraceae bacterium]